jgi:hypothetical protein
MVMLTWIAEKKQCVVCGLTVGACLVVGEVTFKPADAEELDALMPWNFRST